MHQRLNPIGDPLDRLAKLGDGPLGSVSLGDIVGPGVVDATAPAGIDDRRGRSRPRRRRYRTGRCKSWDRTS